MKKQLLQNMLATIVALFIAIIALPTTAQAQDYVDLGLPSGTKWATCNLGASKPSDYGDYYAWGETEPKTEYTWATYKWMQTGQSDWKHITKYTFADGQTEGIWYDSDGTFIGDGKTTLEAADDAATAKLGSPWRMPTLDEIKELLDHCTWTWTTQDGKNGYEVKSKKNGKSIFLPAAGYRNSSNFIGAGSWANYWFSSLGTAYSDRARQLSFDSGERGWGSYDRCCGYTVRPVYAEDYVDLGLPSGIKWATKNLGASKPSDYGDYYAWGETEPKEKYTWATYKWMQTGQSDWKHITKYTFADGQTEEIWYDSDGTFIGDGKTTLEAADDAATAKLGSPWRMPTDDEIKELLDNCTWTWTTQDGKNGYEVKGTNGKSIFLPAAGYRQSSELFDAGSRGDYWSSSLGAAYSDRARDLTSGSKARGRGDDSRYYGFTVRPVYAVIQADTQAPSAPSITSMTSTTNSITVNWSKCTDNMTPQSELRYRVWCGLAGGNEYAGKDIVTNQTSYTVTGLEPDTEYTLYVMAFDKADNVARSAIKAIRTKKAVTKYDLDIAGVQVTSDNCNDLAVIDGVSGTVKYDPATKTLTLEDATINATDEDKIGIIGGIDGLTVQVKGTSSVTTQAAALVFQKSATLTGDGTLNATSNADCCIYIGKTSLTIDGCTVNAKGNWGIAGSDGSVETLTIKNATVTAEGNEYGSICDFKEIVLKNCAITAPSGATIEDGNVMLGGSVCTKQVVIEPTGSDLYDVVLESYNDKKLACVKAVREITGLGLREAKELVESAPCIVTGNLSKSEAETARDKLIAAGGTAKIYPHGTWIPTAIEAVSADVPLKKQGIYNLQGVKMNTAFDRLPKGIYIVDGKKVVKK